MEFVEIAGTELRTSRIGLGTWSIGGSAWGGTDEGEAAGTIESAIARGITFIDTAPVYGFGRSEEIVGKALQETSSRHKVVLATKAGLEWNERGEIRRNSAPSRLRAELEASLRRLRTDVIDLYQIHWPDPRTSLAETARCLAAFYQEGKIRAIGVSNFTPAQMDDFRAGAPLQTSQSPYNIFEREIEADVLPYCRERRIGVLAYGAICRGLLSGRMKPDTEFSADDIRNLDPKFRRPRFAAYLRAVARLDRFARERYGRNVLQLAVRWLLDAPGVAVALWGARHPAQIEPLAGVFGWSTGEQARREIDRITADEIETPIGAGFMAPP